MNVHVREQNISTSTSVEVGSPLAVTDPKIRRMLQLGGLRFAITRAHWLIDEATRIGVALKSGAMTSDQVDAKLEEMGALDLVYPELMGLDQ